MTMMRNGTFKRGGLLFPEILSRAKACRKSLSSDVPKYSTKSSAGSDFSHAVIGGGIVGTAIAAELQKYPGNNVLLLEKNDILGAETTSRNSEVIHAGLYYPIDSLKAKLCIKGKRKIYEAHKNGLFYATQVGLKKCGKWIVAQDEVEEEYLHELEANAAALDVPVKFISTNKAKNKFPHIRAEKAILESPSTGIISAHDLLYFFETEFVNKEGTISLYSKVLDINYSTSNRIYELQVQTGDDIYMVSCDNVVNSAGLYAQEVSNLLLPKERHYSSHFAKGNYFSYLPKTHIPISQITDKLVYPCPNPNISSLGTHLTFDLGGQLRFGPDLEWLEIKKADEIDYTASSKNISAAYEAVKNYFPLIQPGDLNPSYSGVRPKLVSKAESKTAFADFLIKEEEGFPGFINLLGIESPGLTSSWAIAELVRDMYHK